MPRIKQITIVIPSGAWMFCTKKLIVMDDKFSSVKIKIKSMNKREITNDKKRTIEL